MLLERKESKREGIMAKNMENNVIYIVTCKSWGKVLSSFVISAGHNIAYIKKEVSKQRKSIVMKEID